MIWTPERERRLGYEHLFTARSPKIMVVAPSATDFYRWTEGEWRRTMQWSARGHDPTQIFRYITDPIELRGYDPADTIVVWLDGWWSRWGRVEDLELLLNKAHRYRWFTGNGAEVDREWFIRHHVSGQNHGMLADLCCPCGGLTMRYATNSRQVQYVWQWSPCGSFQVPIPLEPGLQVIVCTRCYEWQLRLRRGRFVSLEERQRPPEEENLENIFPAAANPEQLPPLEDFE